MEFQVSARKYRPTSFEEVLGQPHVVQTLINAISRNRVAHAYVFSGMRGVGKTTVARIFAKALNCEQGPTSQPCGDCASCVEIARGNSVDVIEIDGASNTGVDDVRELRENIKFSPFHGTYRVYIIDEVHMLSNSAFNALLKTLEEPPDHSVFIFATTEVHKIPATILSRCQHFTFRRISRLEIIQQLRQVATKVGVQVEDRSLSALARASEGSMRDALSLLDQAVSFGGEQLHHEDLEILIGSVPDELVRRMVEAILENQASQAMSLVGELIDQGYDIRVFCREILERIRNLLIASVVPSRQEVQNLLELGEEEVDQTIEQAKRLSESYLQALFSVFSRTDDSLRGSTHPRFLLEAAAVRAALLDQTEPHSQEKPNQIPSQQTHPSSPPRPTTAKPPSRIASGGVPPTSKQTPEKPLKTSKPQGQVSLRKNPSRAASAPTSPPAPTPTRDSFPRKSAPSGGDPPEPPASENTPSPHAPKSVNWELVVEKVIHEHPNIGSFLEKGSVMSLEANQVVLGYPKKDSIARWRTDKPENRARIAKICTELAGRPMKIQIIELQDHQRRPPSIGELRAKRTQDDNQDLLETVKSHPLVKQAVELFGGTVGSAQRVAEKKEEG